jgi:hypothetical protein
LKYFVLRRMLLPSVIGKKIHLFHRLRDIVFNLLLPLQVELPEVMKHGLVLETVYQTSTGGKKTHHHLGQNRMIGIVLRRCLKHCNLPRSIHIQCQDARCVLVAITVVGCRPDRYQLLIEEVLVPFHHELVSARYEG